jgi:hypothetical protein
MYCSTEVIKGAEMGDSAILLFLMLVDTVEYGW